MLSFIRIIRRGILRFLKNESGASLAELAAGLVIAAMLIALTVSLLLFTGRYFDSKTEQTFYRQQTKLVSDFVKMQVMYSDQVEIGRFDMRTEEDQKQLCFGSNGVVYLNDKELFGQENGNHYVLNIENGKNPEHRYVLTFTVTFLNERNEALYSEHNVVKLVNLELASIEIKYPQGERGEYGYDSETADLYLCSSLAWQEEIK